MVQRKKPRINSYSGGEVIGKPDLFDGLPDDLVVCILCKLSSSASCPADFISVLITCKRLNRLGLHPSVLSKAGPKALAVKAENWSDSSNRFLKQCVAAGNAEAYYTLGMIRFYCLQNRRSGASLMAKAAMKSHATALYSLAVIQFNGSGASKNDKDLRAGVALCARAAYLGHVDALRELGHCLQDGYGVRQNVAEGRRLLVQANLREFMSSVSLSLKRHLQNNFQCRSANQSLHPRCETDSAGSPGCPFLSDYGCNVGEPESHPVHKFLRRWFESGMGLLNQGFRLCSHGGCGRAETRSREFRRCSVCGKVNYCSRGCQALDWKMRHKMECLPIQRWINDDNHVINGDGVDGMVGIEEVGN